MDLRQYLEREAPKFSTRLAQRAHQLGLAVTLKEGATRPIPVTATPVVVPRAELARRVQTSALLSSATFKMAETMLRDGRRGALLGALSPLERELAERTHQALQHLATTRVDFFESVSGNVMALEVNATIPAMQGYSDIAVRALLETVGSHLGLPATEIEALISLNGSNAAALHSALLAGYAKERGGALPRRIGLLSRRNDAQLSEQRYLASRFEALGTPAEVIHPDELSGDEIVRAHGKEFDLVYRHLFVRRLEEQDSPYVRSLFSEVPGRRTVLLNPPCAQVEVKSTFAALSEAAFDENAARSAGLSEDEVQTVRESVPWTRLLSAERVQGPDGRVLSNLVAEVQANPDRFVLKRAWDYGGKAVFVGAAREHPSFDERARASFGPSLRWDDVVARAAADTTGGGFIVQELVETKPERHVLCTEAGASEAELYVDFSAYASVNVVPGVPWGGVCRGSLSQIVNIVGGGGVLPLLSEEVVEKLSSRLPGT